MTTLCIIDGLGHGEGAAKAAKAAVDYVAQHRTKPLADLFAGCDRAMRCTRGVALGIAVIEQAGTLTYAGIGDTRVLIAGAQTIRLGSNYGIVGAGYKGLSLKTAAITPGDLVILSTDGVAEALDLSGYGDDLCGDVGRLAEQILQDWRRETDDAAVLVFRSGVPP